MLGSFCNKRWQKWWNILRKISFFDMKSWHITECIQKVKIHRKNKTTERFTDFLIQSLTVSRSAPKTTWRYLYPAMCRQLYIYFSLLQSQFYVQKFQSKSMDLNQVNMSYLSGMLSFFSCFSKTARLLLVWEDSQLNPTTTLRRHTASYLRICIFTRTGISWREKPWRLL